MQNFLLSAAHMAGGSDQSDRWAGISSTALIAVAVFVVVAAFSMSPAPTDDPVTLPIRVYPSDGLSAHVESVTLEVTDASGIDSLYVQAHQPFNTRTGWDEGVADGTFDSEGAAEIRLNGGEWIPVRDENVDCAYPESNYGCVAGVYSTIRFTIPAEGVQPGANTIEFKYNGTKGVRSGYRVLGVGFMTGGDPSVQDFDPMTHGAHDTSQLVNEDVSEWAPPEGFRNPSDIGAGGQLWNQEGILVELDGQPITASCGSCHAKDGRDLKYFGYSNRVIVARSQAHGLSEEEGKQIAAYIRAVNLQTEEGNTYEAPGRPWSPPYQPGPRGFGPNNDQHPDVADPQYWAAGAGLEWVLDTPREDPNTERDMLAHLFPKDGDPAKGVDVFSDATTGRQELNWRRVSVDSTHNMRSTPVDLQFPDWNNWLPKIHPMDVDETLFKNGEMRRYYQEATAAAENDDAQTVGDKISKMQSPVGLREDGWHNFSQPVGMTDNKFAIARQGPYSWNAVKYWEILHSNHLEHKADDVYGQWEEPLGWLGRGRIPFNLAGHIAGVSGQGGAPWIYANEAMEKTMSHVWYQVQMVLNPSTDPQSSQQQPVDWGYQRGHIGEPERTYGVPSDFRQFQTEIKFWQLASRSGNLTDGQRDWNANSARWRFFARVGMSDNTLRHQLLTAGARAWWDKMRRHPVANFPRGSANGVWKPESDVPEPNGWTGRKDQGQFIYQRLIEWSDQNLLSSGVVDSIGSEWGQPMWPQTGEPPYDDRPRWDEIVDYTPTMSQSIQLNGGWNYISSRVTPADASLDQVFAATNGLAVVKDEEGRTYIPSHDVNEIGLWVPEEGYKAHVETAQEITLTGTPVDVGSPIQLKEGWNLIPYYPDSPMDAATVLAPLEGSLIIAKDEDDDTYDPSTGVNDIGDMVPGKSYLINVSSDTTFAYPSDEN
jgi:cytochrome c553